ncbi:hypothetical protein RCL22_24965, partial [Salmonella enterica subsp. enterica serovar 1,4,[5],12:i:-]
MEFPKQFFSTSQLERIRLRVEKVDPLVANFGVKTVSIIVDAKTPDYNKPVFLFINRNKPQAVLAFLTKEYLTSIV